jgi:hypothetical protein
MLNRFVLPQARWQMLSVVIWLRPICIGQLLAWSCESNFVGQSVAVNMHDDAHVAGFQFFRWQVGF